MVGYVNSFLPRFRYGMIQPRSHEERQRGAGIRSTGWSRSMSCNFQQCSELKTTR
jgi:hypothetical protein